MRRHLCTIRKNNEHITEKVIQVISVQGAGDFTNMLQRMIHAVK